MLDLFVLGCSGAALGPFDIAVCVEPIADVRPTRGGGDVAAVGCASRHGHPPTGWERGRRGHRHGRCAHGRRADVEWTRKRRVLAGLGRGCAPRAERVGWSTDGARQGLVRGPRLRGHARSRLGAGHRPWRGVAMGRAQRAVRTAAIRRATRTGDRVGRGRVCRQPDREPVLAIHPRGVPANPPRPRVRALVHDVRAQWSHACARCRGAPPRTCRDASGHRVVEGCVVLRGCARRPDGRVLRLDRWRDDRRRPCRASRGMGRTNRDDVPRVRRVGNPAERPGHHRPHGPQPAGRL